MYWLLLFVSPFFAICCYVKYRVKSGNFRHQVNSDSDLGLIHILNIGIKQKIN